MSGHIQKRGKNSWRLKFDVGAGVDDPRRIRYFTFRGTKKEAALKLAQLVTENAKGTYVDTTKLTLGDFIEKWLADWAASHVSPATFRGMRTSSASMWSAVSAICRYRSFAPSS